MFYESKCAYTILNCNSGKKQIGGTGFELGESIMKTIHQGTIQGIGALRRPTRTSQQQGDLYLSTADHNRIDELSTRREKLLGRLGPLRKDSHIDRFTNFRAPTSQL